VSRLKKHTTAEHVRRIMLDACEREMFKKKFAALLKTCEDIEQILTFVPATYNHVLPTLRDAIAAAKKDPLATPPSAEPREGENDG
jgi:hypothetical protein